MTDSLGEQPREGKKMKPGFLPVYAVELLFREEPELDVSSILNKIHERIRKTAINTGPFREPERVENEALRRKETTGSDRFELAAVFYHGDYTVAFTDAEVPAQTRLFHPREIREDLKWDGVLQQSWKWEGGEERLNEYRYAVTLCDWYAAMLPFQRRIEMFHSVLASVIETTGCDAVYWQPSGQLIDAGAFISAYPNEPLYGALNVRVYQMQQQDEVLVDTLGLTAIGVPDVQCRVTELTPDRVIPMIYGASYYLYGNGGEVENGQLLGGAGLRWRCERQPSVLGPERTVIDLNPGHPYYAGTQTVDPVGYEKDDDPGDSAGWSNEEDPGSGYRLREEDGTEFRSEREYRMREHGQKSEHGEANNKAPDEG
ncbi:DUF4261 domain-containing protein [Saccharibacillus kuerlensis]|uniref:DUF4261 domain-containing protein n=1 Tax=Saccharibacillus kuerlensis TaxID=459527 RepID=A0ABQ2KVF5_9BACL|nr:DUF4261 domain-containing protein [Saccharibacillus kuerlensis]GGN91578.1 hypothetical protein GCM10010969_03410 [Saccharibacillus kuerlensis]